MPFAIPAGLKIGAIVLVLMVLAGGAFALRHELIEKGKNIVYAQDNAARVKAQEEQIKRDAVLVASQNDYINQLQSSATGVKEKIRVVQGPCIKDGADDPRLGDTVDWLRSRSQNNNGAADSGPKAKDPLPQAGPAAATGRGNLR